jgi:hypothetical protein
VGEIGIQTAAKVLPTVRIGRGLGGQTRLHARAQSFQGQLGLLL